MNCQQRSQQFQRYARNLTEHFLEAGHCPHDEVPDQVDRLIRDWVNSSDRPNCGLPLAHSRSPQKGRPTEDLP